MNINTASRSELIRIVYEQADRIKALESQIAELRARMNEKGPEKPNTPPSWTKANTKKKNHGPRKNRAQGYGRKLDTPTKSIFHSFDACPCCGGSLGQPTVSYTRQTMDIPETPVEITEHVVFMRWCRTCKKRVTPHVNLSSLVVGKQRIGIRLMSIIDFLKETCRQPLSTIQTYLELVHGFHLSEGAMVRILATTAEKGEPVYNQLREEIRESTSVHADETGGRENGKNGYFWSFSTKNVHYLLYRKSRKSQIVEEVLGDSFTGVLSSDFYAAYNIYCGFHQRCWVHYLRDIHTLTEQYPKDKRLKRWAKKIHALYEEAKAYTGPDPTIPPGKKEQERIAKQGYFEGKLRTLCTAWVETDAPMNTLAARAITFLSEMFVFVRFEGVSPDNNAAERILRHTVISRKISGGTKSETGSKTKSIIASLFGTWKLQNKNPLTQCQLLLAT